VNPSADNTPAISAMTTAVQEDLRALAVAHSGTPPVAYSW